MAGKPSVLTKAPLIADGYSPNATFLARSINLANEKASRDSAPRLDVA
jgi:hypothetical protein